MRRPMSLFPALLLLPLVLQQLAVIGPISAEADSDVLSTLTEISKGGKSCSQKADIFFALDSSHSVGRTNFGLVTKFIHEIVSKLLVKSTKFRFGIVIFSDKADMVIKLKDYSMNKPVERKALLKFLLHDLEYKSGKTVTGEAFQLIREQGFLAANGHRADAKPVVVLLTDGRANGRANPVTESRKLRAIGASVVALGIGTGISRSALEKLSSNKKYVTVVNDFEDLGKVGKVITDILCEGEKAASVKGFKGCAEGMQMIARKCVPSKPKCRLKCPKGFMLVFPCKCVPNVSVSDDCKKNCKESEILVKGCVCVPRHVPSKPEQPKVCKKACKGGKKLNAKLCTCECMKKCPGRNFDQKSDCKCECKMRCRRGLALNKAKCTCDKVDCPPRMEFFDGKCMPQVRKYCPAGQILFRDICKKATECPKGYKLRSDSKCYKVGCDPGFKKAKSGRCVKMCSGKKYYFKGKCNDPTPCTGHQYFRVRGSGCPRTCNEPVLFSKCPKERRPQCECRPYFLLHKGKCVHPSDCPNVPICIQKADVIFMLDSSLTVTEHNFYIMKNFVRDVVQQFYLKNGERQRVGLMRFNHKNRIIMDLDSWQHNSHEEILKKIEAIQYEPGLTFLGEALHEVRTKMWQKHAGMREDVPHVTILLTDGADSNGQVDQFYESKLVRRSGVFFVTMAIGQQSKENRELLGKLAGPEGRTFIFGLREFQDIHGLVARVLTFHCEKPLCPHPYLINGDCVGNYKSIHRVEYVPKGYGCKKVVQQDFKKVRCACPKPDSKTGPCKDMFKKVTTTHYKLNKKKGICESTSKDAKVRCGCPSPKKIVGKCEKQYRKITTTNYKLTSGGESGGQCKPETKTKTLRCACPTPTRKYLPCVNNFKIMYETVYEFNRLTRGCIERRRTKEIRCSCPKPQVETGHCNGKIVPIKVYTQRVNSRNQCDDLLWTGSAKCQRTCSKRMDVAFLIDSSDSVRGRNFEHIRRFIVAVAKKLDVSRDNTHVALLKFSSVQRMKVIFNYVSHYHLDSLTTRVMEMEYSPGSTYTGDAIKAFRRFLLNKVNGFRGGESKGAENVVILVTDGASNSKVDPIKEAAKVKAMGCRVITVGVGDDIQAGQLDKIATDPHDIHSFKTSTFTELVDPQFVDDIISATCRVGKVNKVSMKAKYTNKIRDLVSRNVEINWKEMGFKRVNPKDLSQFQFTVEGSYVSTVGDSQKQKSKFLSAVRHGLAKALRIHPYSIRKLYVSRKLLVSGLVRSSKIEKLKSLIEDKELKIKVGKTKLKFDSSSFSTLPYASLEVVRQASEVSDIVLSIMRPLRRLVRSAADSVPRIRRKDARALADKEAAKLKKATSKADSMTDKLLVASNKARAKRDQKLAEKCIKEFKELLETAEKVSRHISYITYFSRRSDKDILKRRLGKVNGRIAQAQKEISVTDDKIAKAPAAKKKGEEEKEEKEEKGEKGEKKEKEEKEEKEEKGEKKEKEEKKGEKKEKKEKKGEKKEEKEEKGEKKEKKEEKKGEKKEKKEEKKGEKNEKKEKKEEKKGEKKEKKEEKKGEKKEKKEKKEEKKGEKTEKKEEKKKEEKKEEKKKE